MRDQEDELMEDPESGRGSVSLTMDMEDEGLFFPLLQGGVNIPARVECTLENFLLEQLGLDPDFVSERVTTIFVDGKTTDRLKDSHVKDGSIIALSAAMPGVVGATLRRGSFYAAMRSGITSLDSGVIDKCINGSVTVKLFNLLLHDLGPFLLARGIVVNLPELSDLFRQLPESDLRRCTDVMIDGKPADPESLGVIDTLVSGGKVTLYVTFGSSNI